MSKCSTSVYRFLFIALLFFPQISLGIDLVFDLDGVLLDPWTTSSPPSKNEIVIEVEGQKYRVANGVTEFFESLLRIPNARISFFSSASESRNVVALGKIILSNGTSLLQLSNGRVFSRQHLTENGKKGLRVIPNIDLENAMIAEDQESYIQEGQERNRLIVNDQQLGKMFSFDSDEEFQIKLEEYQSDGDVELLKELKDAALGNRNKLVHIRGVIELAMRISSNSGISFSDALNQLQHNSTGEVRSEIFKSLRIFKIGLREMKKINPRFKLFTSGTGRKSICDKLFLGN